MAAVEEFFSARASFTPLVAGATVTSVANALSTSFDIRSAWIALAISGLFGAIFLFDQTVKQIGLRVVYAILNTLTVFSVAAGLNSAGVAATERVSSIITGPAETTPRGGEKEGRFFHDWFGG